MKNKIFNIIIIILSAAIFLYFLVFSHGIGYLIEQLRTLNYIWILLEVFSMFMYWTIECIVLNIFTQSISFRQRLIDSFKITMVGQFFNSITPFASGGQPAQLYFMIKRGIKAGSASAILTMKLIVYQGVLTLYSLIAIILKFTFFKENLPNFFYISIIGFLINTGVILFLLMASVNKKVTKSMLKVIFAFFNKIRLVKDVAKSLSKIEEELSNFHQSFVMWIPQSSISWGGNITLR